MAQIHDLVDGVSGDVRSAYGRLVLGMDGAWLGFTDTLGSGPAYSRMHLSASVHGLGDAYTRLLQRIAADGVREAYAQGAQDAAGPGSDPVPPALIEEAQSWPATAVARDLRALEYVGQQTLLRYSVASRSMGPSSAKQAVLGELPSQARNVFVQLDRMARKRNSLDWVDAGVRKTMLDAYGHGFTAALAAGGRNDFQAVHAEGDVVNLGLIDTWPDWQAEHMHPNTRWSLRRTESP